MFNEYKNIREVAYPEHKREYGNKLLFSIISRSFSTIITILLKKIKVRPNFISFFSIFLGCLGIFEIYIGNYLVGSVFVSLCKFFDCVDGELARVMGIFSQKSNWLEPLNSDLQYLFLLPTISFGLLRDGYIELSYLFLSIIAAGGFVATRKIWNVQIWKGETNISSIKKFFYCQFKPSGELRSSNKLGAFFYYLRYNLLAQNGIMYPALILISYHNDSWLIYYVCFYTTLYLSFFIITIIGLTVVPVQHRNI